MSEAPLDHGMLPAESADAVSVGDVLRRAREQRGETVADVAYALKLTTRQVEAMEADRFELLPGPAFVRGFVRNYARYLGMDAAALLANFDKALAAPPIELAPLSNADGVMPSGGQSRRAHVPAAELSHGERRQLEIAIALALAPKAFLFDEPMAGMGPEGSKRLTAFLDGLRNEAPMLLVEHDMDAVFALADRISVLVYGRIIASGTVDEIRSDPEVRRAYLGEAA